ncbi:hypothetical protein BN129_4313 [Cronobacter sakazakii 701]|nr:hypothetical protein BN129_4313 [Cronobacter sakazakii 701]
MVAAEIFPFSRSTSETVETDTPAWRATSIMLTFFICPDLSFYR